MLQAISPSLRLVSGKRKLTLSQADGTERFSTAHDVFGSYPDPKHYKFSNQQTQETVVEVFEQTRRCNLEDIFSGLGRTNEMMHLTPHQIITFCRDYTRWIYVNYDTFFMLKSENGEFFAARSYFTQINRISMTVTNLSTAAARCRYFDAGISRYSPGNRIVLPKQDN